MGRNVVYLPLIIPDEQHELVHFAPPFILTLSGEIKPIIPDISRKQTLTLTRKYPAFRFLLAWCANRVIGAKIQTASYADFRDAVTLHVIQKYGTEAGEILLDTVKTKYRYWRYYSAPGGYCNIAELNFFDHSNIPKQGKIIGTPEDDENYTKQHVFDNDPLTSFHSPDPSDSWVGMDFGEPVNISRILYMPRSDGNNAYITFENCPVGALFLLHDCTRGVQDRIFIYENDKQIWW